MGSFGSFVSGPRCGLTSRAGAALVYVPPTLGVWLVMGQGVASRHSAIDQRRDDVASGLLAAVASRSICSAWAISSEADRPSPAARRLRLAELGLRLPVSTLESQRWCSWVSLASVSWVIPSLWRRALTASPRASWKAGEAGISPAFPAPRQVAMTSP